MAASESMEYLTTPLPSDDDDHTIWTTLLAGANLTAQATKRSTTDNRTESPAKKTSHEQQTQVSDVGNQGTSSSSNQLPQSSFLSIPNSEPSTTSQTITNSTTDSHQSTEPPFQLATGKLVCKAREPYASSSTTITNRFSALTTSDPPEQTPTTNNSLSDQVTTDNAPSRQQPPRPKIGTIHIDNTGLTNATRLLSDLQTIARNGFLARSTKKELIIQPKTLQAHKTLLDALDKIELTPDIRAKYFADKLYYHHHRATEERRDRLVIKGLSPNTPQSEILQELKCYKYPIHHIAEMKRRNPDNTLTGLGIYMIEVNKEDLTDIKTNIKHLLHHRVTIHDYQQNDRIPRCDKCQMYFHTKQYCHRPTTCAKCGGNHHITDCTNDFYKCANCKHDHPAYSQDCPILIKAKQDRRTALTLQADNRQRQQQTRPTQSEFPSLRASSNAAILQQTYAGITQTSSAPTSTPTPNPTSAFSDLKELFSLLKSFNLSKLISIAKEIINILKSTDDTMTKIITILTKVCELI